MYKSKHIKQFFHIHCAIESFRKARVSRSIIKDLNDLDGFDQLSSQDKLYMSNLFDDVIAKIVLPTPTVLPKKAKITQTPPHIRKSKLKSATMPHINVMFTNADQLTSGKLSELKTRIERDKPSIIAVSEVKLKNSKNRDTQDYNIPNFVLYPTNLSESTGRGMAVYIHSSLEKSVIEIKPDIGFEEACLLEIKLRGGDVMLFGSFYRSPTQTGDSDSNNDKLNRLLKCIAKKKYSHRCLIGDFNFREINWGTFTTIHNENSKEHKFIETIQECYLYQHNEENSRRRGNDNPSLLDLVFTDEALQVSDVSHHAPLGKSDHNVITFKFNCYIDYATRSTKYDYEKADYDAMRRNLIESNWEETYITCATNKNTEELWHGLKSKLIELREIFVPKASSKKSTWKDKGSFPIKASLQKAIQKKRVMHRYWMNAKDRGDVYTARLNYTRARNKVKRLIRQDKRKFEKDIADKSESNPKLFWSHVRNKLKTKPGVAPLLANDNDKESMRYSDLEKADILLKQFSSVQVKEPNGDIPKLECRTKSKISDLHVTCKMVKNEIDNMSINKSCGPDEIPARIIKELVSSLVKPITLLLNKSVEQQHLPIDWRRAYVIPIFKKGSKSRAVNYRPISLTSIICKLMETGNGNRPSCNI